MTVAVAVYVDVPVLSREARRRAVVVALVASRVLRLALVTLLALCLHVFLCVRLQTSAGVTDLLYSASADLAPLSHTPPKGLDIYNALIQRLKKPIIELIGACLCQCHPFAYCEFGRDSVVWLPGCLVVWLGGCLTL